jgi:ketosteroid isomerase-like protein
MQAFNARDMDRLFSLLTEDTVVRTDRDWPGGGEFRGRAQIEPFLIEFLDPWNELRYEVREEPVEVGPWLVERGRWHGTGRSSGIEGTIEFTSVARFEAGLMSRLDAFLSHDDALAFANDAR